MDGGAGNRITGQRSRQRAYRAALAALGHLPEGDDRTAWVRRWRGAHGLTVDGLPGRLAAEVRATRARIRQTADVIRRGAEWAQG